LFAEKIKSVLNKQGKKKRISFLSLSGIDRPFTGAEILEISSFLPELQEWIWDYPISGITIEMVREWKRICPQLAIVRLRGLSGEVKVVLQSMGVAVE